MVDIGKLMEMNKLFSFCLSVFVWSAYGNQDHLGIY